MIWADRESPEWIKAKQIVSPGRLAVPVQKFLQIAQIGFHEASHVAKTHSRAPREAPFRVIFASLLALKSGFAKLAI